MNQARDEYDVIVLGAGPIGENVADRTRAAGLSTAIVERELVGGECSYWACVPSKALLRPVLARAEARQVPGLRQAVGGALSAADVFAHRDKQVGDWKDDGALPWLESAGIDLVRGHGRLAGPQRVAVTSPDGSGDERILTARHAVAVCTGTRASLPHLPGIADVHPWTSREATSSSTVPERLIIVGGGVVACEMATAWNGLGSRVTMLVRGSGLLKRIEPFAGELVAETLREAGAEVRTGMSVKSLARPGGADGPVTVTLESGERPGGAGASVPSPSSPSSPSSPPSPPSPSPPPPRDARPPAPARPTTNLHADPSRPWRASAASYVGARRAAHVRGRADHASRRRPRGSPGTWSPTPCWRAPATAR
ncbi:Soluble pyridine nucleotide transhydrogenase [Streptomyces antimycoticus]